MRLTRYATIKLNLPYDAKEINLYDLEAYEIFRFCIILTSHGFRNRPKIKFPKSYYIGWLLYHGYVRW